MKTKALILGCALTLGFAQIDSARANGHPDPGSVVVDTALVRPLCLVTTIFCSAFFVVSLPVAAVSGSVHSTAHALLTTPAKATFTRPLGDLDALTDD
jgi:hypothetical protein